MIAGGFFVDRAENEQATIILEAVRSSICDYYKISEGILPSEQAIELYIQTRIFDEIARQGRPAEQFLTLETRSEDLLRWFGEQSPQNIIATWMDGRVGEQWFDIAIHSKRPGDQKANPEGLIEVKRSLAAGGIANDLDRIIQFARRREVLAKGRLRFGAATGVSQITTDSDVESLKRYVINVINTMHPGINVRAYNEAFACDHYRFVAMVFIVSLDFGS